VKDKTPQTMLAFGWYPYPITPMQSLASWLLFIQRGIMYSRITFLSYRPSCKDADYLLLNLSFMTLLISLCIWLDPLSAASTLFCSSWTLLLPPSTIFDACAFA
jgi:hypothetical protein